VIVGLVAVISMYSMDGGADGDADIEDLKITYESNVKISTGNYEFTFIVVNTGNYTASALANCTFAFGEPGNYLYYTNIKVSVEAGECQRCVAYVDVEPAYYFTAGTCTIELVCR